MINKKGLRMPDKRIINRIILVFVFICFTWLLLNSFRYSPNVYYSSNSFISLIVSVFILVFWYFVYLFLKRKIPENLDKKHEILFLIIYFIIVTIIQIIVLNNLSVNPSWDFGVVFDNAHKFALNNNRDGASYLEYFEYFPNNIMLFVLLVVFIKSGFIFSLSALQSAWIMNILFIDLALLLLFFILNKKYNFKTALFSLVITLFFLPLFLYTPIFYSDTMSMFVGLSFIYIYLLLLEKKCTKGRYNLLLVLMGILTFFGKEIKVTSLIVLVAILFHFLLNTNFKRFLLSITAIAISFLICSLSFKVIIVQNPVFAFSQTGYGSYPYTHWLMMGVEDIDADNSGRNSIGGYNSSDYELTRSYKVGKDAISFNIKEYCNRVKKMGFTGYFNYLTKKGVNTWSDGLYFSDIKLFLNSRHPDSTFYNLLIGNMDTKIFFIYFSQGVQFSFLILLIVGCIVKRNDDDIDYVRLSIFGVMLFLLFWENRSRYLLNFVPIFIIVIVEFYYRIQNVEIFKEKKQFLKFRLCKLGVKR